MFHGLERRTFWILLLGVCVEVESRTTNWEVDKGLQHKEGIHFGNLWAKQDAEWNENQYGNDDRSNGICPDISQHGAKEGQDYRGCKHEETQDTCFLLS